MAGVERAHSGDEADGSGAMGSEGGTGGGDGVKDQARSLEVGRG
jgi:hypothetical protein